MQQADFSKWKMIILTIVLKTPYNNVKCILNWGKFPFPLNVHEYETFFGADIPFFWANKTLLFQTRKCMLRTLRLTVQVKSGVLLFIQLEKNFLVLYEDNEKIGSVFCYFERKMIFPSFPFWYQSYYSWNKTATWLAWKIRSTFCDIFSINPRWESNK